MTREDAYFERILLLAGLWEGYDEWLGYYLENEEPLSDIVLELVDCHGDMKEVEHRLNLYCLEKPFDEESVHERLRLYLWENYKRGKMAKDEVLALMCRFSSRIIPYGTGVHSNFMALSDYYDLVKEGMIAEEKFDKAFCAYLERGERVDTDKLWGKAYSEKYVLITGAYGGMGRKTAELLRDAGYYVLALDRKVGAPERNIIPIEADVTSAESVAHALKAARAYTEKLDAIVHFAGVYMLDSLFEMSEEAFERIFRVNLFGAYLVNKTFLPMLKKGSRIIITTSELAPLDPLPFTGIYAVTKAALDKYAYSLRMEAQLLGIDVCVLRAGAVATDMLGASTTALDKFCDGTKLYTCNAARFKKIVEGVEARNILPEKLARRVLKILGKKKRVLPTA